MKKKIAIVDLLFCWPPLGGASTDIKEVAQRLAKDYDVCLFVPEYDYYYSRGKIQGSLAFSVQIIPLSRPIFHSKEWLHVFRKAVDRFAPDLVFIADAWYTKPDIFHAFQGYRRVLRFYAYECLCLKNNSLTLRGKQCPHYFISGAVDYFFCQACCWIKFFRHRNKFLMDDYMAAKGFSPFFRKKVKDMICQADMIICYNSIVRQMVEKLNHKVLMVPSGVDPEVFTYKSVPKQNPQVILMAGRTDDPLKGYPYLLEACRILYKQRKDFKLVYTARNPVEEQDPFLQHVSWLPVDKLPSLYHQANICVVPSIWPEAFGIVALEAMATGRPVIATNVGGLGKIPEHDQDGFIVEPKDIQQLAYHLNYLLDNPQGCVEMGKKGREKVVKKYTWDSIYQKFYKKTFEDLLDQ